MAKGRPSPVLQGIKAFFKWLMVMLGTLLLICAATGAILACYAAGYIQTVIIPEAQEATAALDLIRSDVDLTSAIYYYNAGSGAYEVQETLYGEANRVWISYDELPEDLINATVAIEDKRFWTHGGVDWVRTASSMLKYATGGRQEGGSTITQQLIKNLTGNNEVTVRRKVLEIFEALEFDNTHTKEETLEWYLNVIFLGRQCYGVSTASYRYFGKDVSELSLAECASLISITNNPSLYDPYNHPDKNYSRRCLVLDEMCEQEMISEAERDAAKAEEIVFQRGEAEQETESTSLDNDEYFSWYTDTVIREVALDLMEVYGVEDYDVALQMIYSGGMRIYSCLDPTVQQAVDNVYEDTSRFAGNKSDGGQDLQSAITVVDNSSGAVVAISGGMGQKEGNLLWNRATRTLRPPGSSIKPLSVYAPALEMGILTPDDLIEDSPITLSDGTTYPTSNSGRRFTGDMVTVDYGLTQSLNSVAVQILNRVSPRYAFNFLQERFGITSLVEEYTSPTGRQFTDLAMAPLALGGLTYGVSTYELTAAYAVFARDGLYVEPYVYTVVTNSSGEIILCQDGYELATNADGSVTVRGYAAGDAVLKQSTVDSMDEMLQHVVTRGTGSAAQIGDIAVAGKTGTTDDDYDRWFAGYTERYTAAVWTGYENADTVNYDGNPAVDLWHDVMVQIN